MTTTNEPSTMDPSTPETPTPIDNPLFEQFLAMVEPDEELLDLGNTFRGLWLRRAGMATRQTDLASRLQSLNSRLASASGEDWNTLIQERVLTTGELEALPAVLKVLTPQVRQAQVAYLRRLEQLLRRYARAWGSEAIGPKASRREAGDLLQRLSHSTNLMRGREDDIEKAKAQYAKYHPMVVELNRKLAAAASALSLAQTHMEQLGERFM